MAQAKTEPKPILPFLQPFYDAAIPLSWLVVRVAVGWNLLVHGWNKILTGPTDAFRNPRRHCAHSRPVHPVSCRGCRDRDADHHRDLLG
jgi:hypothetical protein